jgi:hypothetical protein
MKNILFFLIFIPLILFSQTEKSYLTENDVEEIMILKKQFDNVLKKYYPTLPLENAYKQYLTDLEQRRVNGEIIKEKKSIEVFNYLKETSVFEKIWIKNQKDPEDKAYLIDYTGDFYNYLIQNTTNKNVKKGYVEFIEISNSASPFLLVSALKTYLKDSDYKSNLNKMSISILFYYDILSQFIKE